MAEIGRERIAELFISGPKIATTQVYAMSRDGAEVHAQEQQGMAKKSVVFHTHRFEHAVEPTKPIEGVVRDKDSGQPIAGLTLHAAVFEEYSFVPAQGIEATTDAQGRYRLSGLPRRPPIGCLSSRATVSLTPQRTFGHRLSHRPSSP